MVSYSIFFIYLFDCQSVSYTNNRLNKTDISKAFVNNFDGDKELAWENNSHFPERRNLGWVKNKLPMRFEATNPISVSDRNNNNISCTSYIGYWNMQRSRYRNVLTAVTLSSQINHPVSNTETYRFLVLTILKNFSYVLCCTVTPSLNGTLVR